MRPTLSRAFSTSITSKAGAGAKPSGSFVRRTDELAKRHDLSKMSPHAWNDVPAPTHLQLEAERERRHFARLVALDLPQLSQFENKFQPPAKNHSLQLRVQHYLGESHPAQNAVSLSVPVSQLPLKTDSAKHNFRLLAGPRWDSTKDEFKVARSAGESREDNAKWCSSVLDRLIKHAHEEKDLGDIPLDYRPAQAKANKRKGGQRSRLL